ncbi:MAG: hypothetical protein GAK40_01042 [Burkholderia plantarii]|nr:MAG: hypothetical protein GAK40_01042 [Burkholderia plantarii]
MSRLRQRLRDEPREPRYIKTLRSEGYVFSSAVTALEASHAADALDGPADPGLSR